MVGERGVTLVELLVYIAIVGVVMTAVFTTFKRQQDSYMVQERLAVLQQNLRGAMSLLSSDLQMAGYYSCYEPQSFPFPFDWAFDWDGDTANETIRPLLFGQSNSIVIIKANSDDKRHLVAGESAAAGTNTIAVTNNLGFDTTSKQFGVIVKSDLSRAEFFRVTGVGGNLTVSLAGAGGFKESYFYSVPPPPPPDSNPNDLIARADIIRYWVDANNNLIRTNLGDSTTQVVAEYVSGMQLSYAVVDDLVGEDFVSKSAESAPVPGEKADNKPWDERDIRRIQVTLTGTVQVSPRLGSKQRSLSSTVKVRNMGMEML
jgi:type II secretory pathway pseudopilin PulG